MGEEGRERATAPKKALGMRGRRGSPHQIAGERGWLGLRLRSELEPLPRKHRET